MLQQSRRKNAGNLGTRVKVAVRCRPPFQDEIDFAKGDFFSILDAQEEDPEKNTLGKIGLTMISGKQRDFYFDYIFGETAAQDQVYDRLARPIVADVLKGCNGTIFAYGQTGTGKTYTMGILEFVHNEHAGLIPRAIAQIFEYVDSNDHNIDMTISLSFLQLYRETIQDLLAHANGNATAEDNLLIREDPIKGFYVEGLQEFVVRSYLEAEALINLGLENRAIAPTMMNSTSSRSHTVLTINIEQRVSGNEGSNTSYSKTLRSKLLMVDLAGSERVRRTVSKGTRLSEAKSINTSLSALGNVIAALAESNSAHIPYRDSKLTRLLQDSLGGTAATALIATIGPAAINYGETLSTLLFAQRCMAVKVTPIRHEEVDYAEMCAKLQAQLAAMQGSMTEKLVEQQSRYEQTILDLQNQLEDERERSQQNELLSVTGGKSLIGGGGDEAFQSELNLVLSSVEKLRDLDPDAISQEDSWFNKPQEWKATRADKEQNMPNGPLVSVLAYSVELIRYLSTQLQTLVQENQRREEEDRRNLADSIEAEAQQEMDREWERSNMAKADPRAIQGGTISVSEGDSSSRRLNNTTGAGGHLLPLNKLDAMRRVEGQHRSNNAPVSRYDRVSAQQAVSVAAELLKPSIHQYASLDELVVSLGSLHQEVAQNMASLNTLLARKDVHFKRVKQELISQIIERRRREEEVVNWSYILKYLLKSASKLRKELHTEKRANQQSAAQQTPLQLRSQQQQSVQNSSRTPENNRPFSSGDRSYANSETMSTSSSIAGSSLSGGAGTPQFLAQYLNYTGGDPFQDSKSKSNSDKARSGILDESDQDSAYASSAGESRSRRSQQSNVQQQLANNNGGERGGKGGSGRGRSSTIESLPPPPPPAPSTTSSLAGGSGAPSSRRGDARGQQSTAEYQEALERVKLRANTAAAYGRPTTGQQQKPLFRRQDIEDYDEDEEVQSDYNGSSSYADSESASEYSLASSARSFRSGAATPVSLQPPSISSAASKGGTDRLRPRASTLDSAGSEQSAGNLNSFQPVSISRAPAATNSNANRGQAVFASGSGAGNRAVGQEPGSVPTTIPGTGSSNHAVGLALAKKNKQAAAAKGPSAFAQEVARSLGVEGAQARDAMAIIDQISSISPAQLEALDAGTRAEILQLRSELGIDKFLLKAQQQQSSSGNDGQQGVPYSPTQIRASQAEINHIERQRSFSQSSTLTTTTAASARSASAGRSKSPALSTARAASGSAMIQGDIRPPAVTQGSTSRSNSNGRSNSASRSGGVNAGGSQRSSRATTPTSSIASASIRSSQPSSQQYLQAHSLNQPLYPQHPLQQHTIAVDLSQRYPRASSNGRSQQPQQLPSQSIPYRSVPSQQQYYDGPFSGGSTSNNHLRTAPLPQPQHQHWQQSQQTPSTAAGSVSSLGSSYASSAPRSSSNRRRERGGDEGSAGRRPIESSQHQHRKQPHYGASYYTDEEHDDEFSQLDSMG